MSYAIEMIGINKNYGLVKANNNVNLKVKKGEIHALIGENGAGKTTLVNILFGLVTPDSGQIKIMGEDTDIKSPDDAIENGLGMIHQHFKLVPSLTVAENIFLGQEIISNGLINNHKQIEKAQELAIKYNLNLNPESKIENISVGAQQKVEILKVLSRGTEILIMDEPTAVLTPQEVDVLFKNLREFVNEQNMTIIFITHHLDEVMEIADNITVLRKGEVVGNPKKEDCNKQELAAMMIGRELSTEYNISYQKPGDIVLQVEDLWCRNDRGLPALRGINFNLREGEILGVAGVAGNGQTELSEVISGLRQSSHGNIYLKGKSILELSPREIRDKGMAHVPGDRMTRGVDSSLSIKKNFLLGNHYKEPWVKNGLIQRSYLNKRSRKMIDEFNIKASNENNIVGYLSGGNIQKVVVAREFSRDADFMLVDQPTRGIDIGSKKAIHDEILDIRRKGKAILLISVQLEEILNITDRIIVLFNGQITGEVDPNNTTEEELGLLMAGVTKEGVRNNEMVEE